MCIRDSQQGVYSRVVEFQDASFQAARESEQREIYENWSELLNTFDNTCLLYTSRCV